MEVGPPDRTGPGHLGVAEDRVLDDTGLDVVTAADDEVLGPAGQPDESLGVDTREIAGVEPSVDDLAEAVGDQSVRVAAGDVPGKDGGAADRQGVDLAGRQVLPGAVGVDAYRLRLLVGHPLAHRPGTPGHDEAVGGGAGGLCQAVSLQQRDARR